jgi:hypothetical protein
MRLEDLTNHELDVLIDVKIIGSRVRKRGRDEAGRDLYVRVGGRYEGAMDVPPWSSNPEQSQILVELWSRRGPPAPSLSPREIATFILKNVTTP